MPLQAIPTRYAGHFFRSRAEARYAVFLDSLGVKWEYETEGYRLPGVGNYLPDFRLPELNTWIEIKGKAPSADERKKARALFEESGEPAYIFFDGMMEPVFNVHPFRVTDGARAVGFDQHRASTYIWAECNRCHSVGIVGVLADGRGTHKPCSCFNVGVNPLGKYLKASYEAARTARFEYSDYNHRAPRLRPVLRQVTEFTPAKARRDARGGQ